MKFLPGFDRVFVKELSYQVQPQGGREVKREWRQHNRSDIGIPLEFQGRVSSLAKNISESGMLCRTSRQLDEMTLLDIRFQLPKFNNYADGKVWVQCSGVVVRCEKADVENIELPYEVAIFFDRISEENKNLLASYCTNHKLDS